MSLPYFSGKRLTVSSLQQSLTLSIFDEVIKSYPIATARLGMGEEQGSEKTPRGLHEICAKIGDGSPCNTIFRSRRAQATPYQIGDADKYPGKDWILTRILWLSGLEPAWNRYGDVDTRKRYVYIHGMPDDKPIDEKTSHGCIRMRNADIIELYHMVTIGTPVEIN